MVLKVNLQKIHMKVCSKQTNAEIHKMPDTQAMIQAITHTAIQTTKAAL